MAKIIKPPTTITPESIKSRPSVMLLGSIELGVAEDWQSKVAALLDPYNIDIYNPRREQWNNSWSQNINNPLFKGQVEWELTALENANVKLMYFSPDTKHPISLLELGLLAGRADLDVVVCCPEGFWGKGNVDIVCARYGIHQEPTLEDAVADVISRLNHYHGVPRIMKEYVPNEESPSLDTEL